MKFALVALIAGVNSISLYRPGDRSYINFAEGVDETDVSQMNGEFIGQNQ